MELINSNGFILHNETLVNKDDCLHYHPSYELFMMMKGSTTILVDDKLIPIEENDILLLKPNIIHKNIGEKLHNRYSIHFTDEYLLSHFSDNLARSLISPFNNHKITVTDSVFQEISRLLSRIKSDPLHACIHTAEIITLLTDRNNLQMKNAAPLPKTVDHILAYIRKNYADITGLNEIAKSVPISKPYLCQVFKKETGVTISEYLNGIRISNACEMLRGGKYNITQIAMLCGYNSTPYFCRIFKDIMRMTPKEYQKTLSASYDNHSICRL